jgi:hypothetical protein
MSLIWYIVLGVLFLGVLVLAVPGDKPAPPPDPREVMIQMKKN